MWFFSKLKELSTPGVQEVVFSYPQQSQLSDPKVQFLKPQHIRILREMDWLGKVTANKFNKISSENSADKRINELYHLGYLDAEKGWTYFLYSINDKGRRLIGNI